MFNLKYFGFDPPNGENKIKPKEYFIDAYVDGCFKSYIICDSTKILYTIFYYRFK